MWPDFVRDLLCVMLQMWSTGCVKYQQSASCTVSVMNNWDMSSFWTVSQVSFNCFEVSAEEQRSYKHYARMEVEKMSIWPNPLLPEGSLALSHTDSACTRETKVCTDLYINLKICKLKYTQLKTSLFWLMTTVLTGYVYENIGIHRFTSQVFRSLPTSNHSPVRKMVPLILWWGTRAMEISVLQKTSPKHYVWITTICRQGEYTFA